MFAARRPPPVNLVGWIAGDIGAELPEITTRSDLASAMQSAAQTDGRSARLINQLWQFRRKGAGGGNMILHGGGDQLVFLLQVGKRIGNQPFGGKAFGACAIGQAKPMAQNRNGEFFDILDRGRKAPKQHRTCPARQ